MGFTATTELGVCVQYGGGGRRSTRARVLGASVALLFGRKDIQYYDLSDTRRRLSFHLVHSISNSSSPSCIARVVRILGQDIGSTKGSRDGRTCKTGTNVNASMCSRATRYTSRAVSPYGSLSIPTSQQQCSSPVYDARHFCTTFPHDSGSPRSPPAAGSSPKSVSPLGGSATARAPSVRRPHPAPATHLYLHLYRKLRRPGQRVPLERRKLLLLDQSCQFRDRRLGQLLDGDRPPKVHVRVFHQPPVLLPRRRIYHVAVQRQSVRLTAGDRCCGCAIASFAHLARVVWLGAPMLCSYIYHLTSCFTNKPKSKRPSRRGGGVPSSGLRQD
ncbi:hypothetical protein C8Q72DRAFT_195585 [Fomitopsis betulina]|nr:hypothetical protein C8Q72DRAFT_195585 [Fomitopsis betulina]